MLKGLPFFGKLSEYLNKVIHATLSKIGSSKVGLDVVNRGYAVISNPLIKEIIEAGSTDNLVVKTAHTFKIGDILRLAVTANNIIEEYITVDEIVDANTVKIAGYISASLTAGDTYDHLRPVLERLAPDGSSMASFTAPPIQFNRRIGGTTAPVTVLKDLDTPANSQALPVMLYGVNGTLAVTTDTLDINLTHAGAQGDSVAIGNGDIGNPKLWDIDAVNGAGLIRANSLDIRPLAAGTDRVAIRSGANELAINASGEASIDKSGLATSAAQTTNTTAVAAVETAVTAMHADIGDVADAFQVDHTQSATLISFVKGITSWLSNIRTRLDSALAVSQSGVWSVGVSNQISGYSTASKQDDQTTLLSSVSTNTTNLEARLDTLITALNTLNAKLPTIGQQTMAVSQSVVLASNHTPVTTKEVANVNGTSSVVTLAFNSSSFAPPANAVGFVLKNRADSNEAITWNLGAAANANDSDLLPAQGTAFIPYSGTVYVASIGQANVAISWVRS